MSRFDHWLKPVLAVTPFAQSQTSAESATEEAPDSGLAELLAALNALAASGKGAEAASLQQFIAAHFPATIQQMNENMGKVAAGTRNLSVQAAHAAAHLDPNALGRILDRMDDLGDATLRQIEGRIGVTVSREDRRQLQALRDEMRSWLDVRDMHLQDAQLAVDELSAHASELREDLLVKSERLAKAAEIASFVARNADLAGRNATPEAGAFTSALKNVLSGTGFASD